MTFKYDIITLIELVESQPCLWNKSIEEYKDKLMKQKAWMEVYRFLEQNYDNLTSQEKKVVGDKITTKWTYIKDAYLKSLKRRPGQGTKRIYIYGNHLKFLSKRIKKELITVDPLNSSENLDSSINEEETTSPYGITTPDLSTNDGDTVQSPIEKRSRKVATSTRKLDNIEMQILEELKNNNPQTSSQTTNDDDKFFQSFLPYIRDMTEFEKINLQMDILNAIANIKQNRSQD